MISESNLARETVNYTIRSRHNKQFSRSPIGMTSQLTNSLEPRVGSVARSKCHHNRLDPSHSEPV